MTEGKNKLLRYCRLYVNAGDLSGDSRQFGTALSGMEIVDMAGWPDTIRKGIPDQSLIVGLNDYQCYMNDDVQQAFTLLKDPGGVNMLTSMVFGGGGAPTAGDPVYMFVASQFSSRITIDDRKPVLTANFLPDPNINPYYKPDGRLLLPRSAVTGGIIGATVDHIAATTVAYHAHLHILVAGGNFTFKVRHSTNGTVWADLITFTANGSALTSERQAGTGTVNQYRRVEVTQTTPGACEAVVVFASQ